MLDAEQVGRIPDHARAGWSFPAPNVERASQRTDRPSPIPKIACAAMVTMTNRLLMVMLKTCG